MGMGEEVSRTQNPKKQKIDGATAVSSGIKIKGAVSSPPKKKGAVSSRAFLFSLSVPVSPVGHKAVAYPPLNIINDASYVVKGFHRHNRTAYSQGRNGDIWM